MKNFKLLTAGEEVCLVVKIGAKEYEPFILRGVDIYEPNNNFRPINPRPRQNRLHNSFIPEAERLMEEGEVFWNKVREEELAMELAVEAGNLKHSVELAEAREQLKTLRAEAATGKDTKTSGTPQSTLDELIADSVAKISSDKVLEKVKPMISDYVMEEFGVIPRVLKLEAPNINGEVKGVTHRQFDNALKLVYADIPVFLTGAAGSGKNVLCKQIAEALELEFYFSNAVTQEYKLTGFIDANGRYHETQFYKAFKEGGLFMLDEIDASAPDVLVMLNAAIANGYFDFPIGKVDRHDSFRIVAAGNTVGTGADIEYTGRYQLDASSLDRFAIVEVDYDKDIELAIAGGNVDIVNFIRDFRSTIDKAGIKFVVSYRAIDRLTKLEGLFDCAEAIRLAVLRGLPADDVAMVARNLPGNGNKYNRQLKAFC